VALEYSYGSGDGDATDRNVGTFQNLFPTNHPPYGHMDTASWQNLNNLVLRTAVKPHEKVKVTLDAHAFWLDETADAWYRANGVTEVRAITPSANNFTGCELDLTMDATLTNHLSLLLGYAHFFAGDYLHDTGAGDAADFAYLMLTLNY
jgi:hypothetical protein